MTIEIVGPLHVNKGDQLMLRTVLAEVRKRLPCSRFVINASFATREERRSLGLGDLIFRPYRNPLVRRAHSALASYFRARPRTAKELMPPPPGDGRGAKLVDMIRSARAARSIHSAVPAEVDVVLDVNGYAFGDPWGSHWTRFLPAYYRSVADRGGRVILLPQALGPFTDAAVAAQFREIHDVATLVYARDESSYRYAAQVAGESGKLRQAPDITVLDPDPIDAASSLRGKACVIPNINMIEKTPAEISQAYPDFLRRVVAQLAGTGIASVVVLHDETGGDEEIAKALVASAGGTAILEERDAFRLKALIGSSQLVVSSRFHGTINALSQGVPVLATSWAHKYEHVLADYGVPDALIDPRVGDAGLSRALRRLIEPESRARIVRRLRQGEADRRARVGGMWDEVMSHLTGAGADG